MKPAKDEAFLQRLASEGIPQAGTVIPRHAGERQGEMSAAQRRVWMNQARDPRNTAYNVMMALRIEGTLSPAAVDQGLRTIVARHEALRTCFAMSSGRPIQQVVSPDEVGIRHIALGRDLALAGIIAAVQARPFDLERGPLFDFTLVRLTDRLAVLLVCIHHIVFDLVSAQVVFEEFGALYTCYAAGQPGRLPAPRIHYLDYSEWRRAGEAGAPLASALRAWEQILGRGDEMSLPELRGDRPLSAEPAFEPTRESFDVPHERLEQIRRKVARAGISPFAVWLAGFLVLLHRYFDEDDFVVCLPHSEREHPDLLRMVGFFVNLVPIRMPVRPRWSFTQLVRAVQQEYLEATSTRACPFDQLVERLAPPRRGGVSRLLDISFAYQRMPATSWRIADLRASVLDVNVPTAKSELLLSLFDEPARCRGHLDYNAARFSAAMIRDLVRDYHELLGQLLEAPDTAIGSVVSAPPMGDAVQEADLGTVDGLLHGGFEKTARIAADAVALVAGDVHVTYGALNARANQVARQLIRRGVRMQTPVGTVGARGVHAYMALLGILKAGGVLVPADLAHSAAYILQMFETADVRHVLLHEEASSPSGPPSANSHRSALERAGLDTLDLSGSSVDGDTQDVQLPWWRGCAAYVCFTSGSTGDSKAVCVGHAPAALHIRSFGRRIPIGPADRVLQFANLTFDVSIEQMFAAWSAGATLVARGDAIWSAREFRTLLEEEQVTIANPPTAYWNQVVKAAATTGSALATRALREMIVGGEAMATEIVRLWREVSLPGTRLRNAYGPTEAVITATIHDVTDRETGQAGVPVSIGHPLSGRIACVVDREGMSVPSGAAGELCLGGEALAFGYLKDPRSTALRFIPDASGHAGARRRPGGRLYRTGDLVRRGSGGALDFIGRRDDEVKIRGVRVRPSVVEALLLEHAAILEAAVVVREGVRLAGYYVSRDGARPGHVRAFLEERLPAYVVPAELVSLESLPKTVSGKIDRRALAARTLELPERSARQAPRPTTDRERQMVAIWKSVLHQPQLTVDDNFFEIGGHSLLATQIIMEIEQTFGVAVPLNVMFTHPTVAQLCQHLDRCPSVPSAGRARVVRDQDIPVSYTQSGLWYASQLADSAAAYKIVKMIDLEGRINVAAIEDAVSHAVHRHESLRTCFDYAGDHLVQRIQPARPVLVEWVDLSALSLELAHEAWRQRIAPRLMERPFDLERGPVLRCVFVQFSERLARLVIEIHHIAVDGWSVGTLVHELNSVMHTMTRGWPSEGVAEVQYRHYAAAERARVDSETIDHQRSYWRTKLAGVSPLDLCALGGGRRPRERDGEVAFAMSPAVSARIVAQCRRLGLTPFLFLVSAYASLLHTRTGATDIAIGTDVANRDSGEFAGVVGPFTNQVVLRLAVTGDTGFERLCHAVRDTAQEAFLHKDVPYAVVVRDLHGAGGTGDPLFRAKFVFHHRLPIVQLDGVKATLVDVKSAAAKYDVLLNVEEAQDGFSGSCEYRGRVLDEAAAVDLVTGFQRVCAQVTLEPDITIDRLRTVVAGAESTASAATVARAPR